MGITEVIAIVGALVGGVAARQRKLEAERLNEQLRRINLQLRQQARAGTIYAPGLLYAPVGGPTASGGGVGGGGGGGGTATATRPETQAAGAVAAAEAPASAPPSGSATALTSTDSMSTVTLSSFDDETPEQLSCRQTLREGKRLLRNNQGARRLLNVLPACADMPQDKVAVPGRVKTRFQIARLGG